LTDPRHQPRGGRRSGARVPDPPAWRSRRGRRADEPWRPLRRAAREAPQVL